MKIIPIERFIWPSRSQNLRDTILRNIMLIEQIWDSCLIDDVLTRLDTIMEDDITVTTAQDMLNSIGIRI